MMLDRFFHPRSIAVVGISRSREKLGSVVFRNLIAGGFRGPLYPVHPTMASMGSRQVFSSVKNIPRVVDLAVIVTPAATVPNILHECGLAGIKRCVVISAGFRETGSEGAHFEAQLIALAQRYHISLLGPNCLGFLHGGFAVNASFAKKLPPEGNVALVSQSGAMAVAITDWARTADVHFRSIVSLGNKAGLSEVELLDYFARDRKTKAVLLYLESCERGQAFLAALRRTVRQKPVVILKAGESDLGQRAAASHTGALAASNRLFAAAVAQTGAIHVHRIEELFDMALLLSRRQTMAGPRVALLTNAGGPGIMASDALAATQLRMAVFRPATVKNLQQALPPAAGMANPVDLMGDAGVRRYADALAALGRDSGVDAVLVILTPQIVTQPEATAHAVLRMQRRFPSTVFAASFLGAATVASARSILRRGGIPHFAYPEDALLALDGLWHHVQRARHAYVQRRNTLRPQGDQLLVLPPAAMRLLKRHGLRPVPFRLASSEAGAVAHARALGYPLAVKFISRAIIHKAASDALWLNLRTPKELRAAMRDARRRFRTFLRPGRDEGLMLQRMIPYRSEWLLGARRDPSFGIAILLGRGGVNVEREEHFVTLFAPFSSADVQLAIGSLMPGAKANVDARAIATAARRLLAAMRSQPRLAELEVNPLLVGKPGEGASVVDARGVFLPR